ncbi:c-type cytochrome biogenesis protein CcmI [Roseicella aquatilis]|uniref:C-type cytochrome biogenesis protein CcmI n=1 Tax=Roseicella aquatilis TaxID=2527868 RepID=A0A4R4DTB5_9PROT|nr:c-type cytochrome biogenesis protein CcmI [Roseicella aquatilis]TCZ66069.1 c-type cytochrome biogenesis protein CcmI [Roseicella aquatilis]
MSWFPFWPLLGLLAVAALLPLAAALFGPPRARGRREADLALYRAQLAELERERDAGRLDEAEHRAAMLEVQRRLLTAPAEAGPAAGGRSRWALLGGLAAAPALALALYLPSGIPQMPSAPYAARQAAQREAVAEEDRLLGELRNRLLQLPRGTARARDGWLMLANAERKLGRLDAAAEAFGRALEGQFAPDLARPLVLVLLADRHDAAATARDEAALAEARAMLAALPAESTAAPEGWMILAGGARERGKLDLAAEAYRQVLQRRFDPQLAGQLAQVLLEDNRTEEAGALLADALPQAPGDVGLRFLTGLAQAQSGRTEAARATWQALIAEAPEGVPWRGMVERRMQALP